MAGFRADRAIIVLLPICNQQVDLVDFHVFVSPKLIDPNGMPPPGRRIQRSVAVDLQAAWQMQAKTMTQEKCGSWLWSWP